MALSKANRLRRRQDFTAVYQKGIRCRTRHLTLRALSIGQKKKLDHKPDGQPCSVDRAGPPTAFLPSDHPIAHSIAKTELLLQIGISISQKVSKRAVVRNRIKRQIRAALRQLLPQLATGWKLVVVVHPQAVQCDYFQFLQELEQLMIEAKVLNGRSGRGLL